MQAAFVEAFADVSLTPRCRVVDERTAALEFEFHGRQIGRFLGIPATGRTVDVPMTLVCENRRGWNPGAALYYDAGTVLRQLGVAL